MQFDCGFHPDVFVVLPTLAIARGECTDINCGAVHWCVQLSWMLWSLEATW